MRAWRLLIKRPPAPNGDRGTEWECGCPVEYVRVVRHPRGPSFPLHQLGTTSAANSLQVTLLLTVALRPSHRCWKTMASIRVKTSRSFYKPLEEDAPSTPALPNRRARSKSVIEVFSGAPFLQSPDPQSPRPQSYAPKLGGARLSRVSQQISNSSREALPGPSANPQYRASNASHDNTGMWDEDQNEAVIDHLDVIGVESPSLLGCLRRK